MSTANTQNPKVFKEALIGEGSKPATPAPVPKAPPTLTKVQQNPLCVNPGDDIIIVQMGKAGRIKGMYVTKDYIQYEIRYAIKGEMFTEWFGASEIDTTRN